jgi:hypothetical protein
MRITSTQLSKEKYFGVGQVEIKDTLESYIPENNRSQLVKKVQIRLFWMLIMQPSSMFA